MKELLNDKLKMNNNFRALLGSTPSLKQNPA